MLTITECRKKDINGLRDLFFKVRQTTFLWADQSKLQISDFENETENEYILVAFYHEALVGFVSVWVADNFIHHLYIDEKYQKQGIGTQLIKTVIDKISLPISLKCEENKHNAVLFYKKKGFVEKEKGQSEHGTYILFELTKPLS